MFFWRITRSQASPKMTKHPLVQSIGPPSKHLHGNGFHPCVHIVQGNDQDVHSSLELEPLPLDLGEPGVLLLPKKSKTGKRHRKDCGRRATPIRYCMKALLKEGSEVRPGTQNPPRQDSEELLERDDLVKQLLIGRDVYSSSTA